MVEGLFQPTHLLIITVIVLIVFGPGKLAGVGGALGQSVREFKEGTREHPPILPSASPTIESAAATATEPAAPHIPGMRATDL